jgi:hypothetical protein
MLMISSSCLHENTELTRCTHAHNLQDSTDKVLALLSALENLGKGLSEKHVFDLEEFYIQTAFAAEAAVHRVTALTALESFDGDIREEFPVNAKSIVHGNYNLEPDFSRMQPAYKPAVMRLIELRKLVPDHANIHLIEIERKYEETMKDIRKKVKR